MPRLTLALALCIFSLGLAACAAEPTQQDQRYGFVEGVLEEIGSNDPALEPSTGAWFGNDSVRLTGGSLILKIKDDAGTIYILEVLPGRTQGPETLRMLLKVGMRVSFPTKRYDKYMNVNDQDEKFCPLLSQNNIGKVNGDQITYVSNKKG